MTFLDVGERLERALHCVSGDMRLQREIHAGTGQNGRQIALQGRLQLGGIVRAREPKLQLDIRHAVLHETVSIALRLAQGLSQIGIGIST
jgi:hypothetical protein